MTAKVELSAGVMFEGANMSIVIDVFIWLLIESFFGFVFYSTGCLILKVFTLGRYKIAFKDFTTFRASKEKNFNLVWLLGMLFYIALILFIIYLNN